MYLHTHCPKMLHTTSAYKSCFSLTGRGGRWVTLGRLAELRSHAFLLTGIFLNLACHTVDTISKINLWFTAHGATLAFVKMGRKSFDKDTQVDIYTTTAQPSASGALINRLPKLLIHKSAPLHEYA